jgi:predicted ATPase
MPPPRVVITGGPGAGKTALLEMVRRHFCPHVVVLAESAGIVFGGGFPRRGSDAACCAAQRAIYRVEVELERLAVEEGGARAILCDRGTLDGLAYWPAPPEQFWRDLGTTEADELGRYAAVIHLRTPSNHQGYNHSNPLRIESAREAHRIDERIAAIWSRHPRRFVVDHAPDFRDKVTRAIELIEEELPACPCGHTGR